MLLVIIIITAVKNFGNNKYNLSLWSSLPRLLKSKLKVQDILLSVIFVNIMLITNAQYTPIIF